MQQDLFGNTEINDDVFAAPIIENGVVQNPNSILLNKFLVDGNLYRAVNILQDKDKKTIELILLSAGFAVPSARSKIELLTHIQKDLISASRLNMDGYAFEREGKIFLQEQQNANTLKPEGISIANHVDDSRRRADSNSTRKQMDAGLAGNGETVDHAGGIRRSIHTTTEHGNGSPDGIPGQIYSPDQNRVISGNELESEPADTGIDINNHVIEHHHQIAEGSLLQKYINNIRAIKLIKQLDADKRTATLEERIALAKYTGFGALKSVFDSHSKQWSAQYLELKNLLTQEEYDSARASILNAHYTPRTIVNSMYEITAKLGFRHGNILDSSMGSGNFFGLMPQEISSASNLYGVELDVLTSKLAKHLYPRANIAVATAFENYTIPGNTFDLAIGNPPYGSEQIRDAARSDYSGLNIHNYFLCKKIDKVREGGLVVAIVSNAFMDSSALFAREWISKRANLIGAVRLPNTTFQQNAGTEVVTDIVIFQKTNEPVKEPSWINTESIEIINPETGEAGVHKLNQYFIDNPQYVLGIHSSAGSMYRGNSYTVEETVNVEESLNSFVQTLPGNIYQNITREISKPQNISLSVPENIKIGCYYLQHDLVMQRGDDFGTDKTALEWIPKNAMALERMKAMINLKSILLDQITLELNSDDIQQQERNRALLNRTYEEFKQKYGFLNGRTNKSIFLDDTESPLLLSLEVEYDPGISKVTAEETKAEPREPSAKKADIFTKRVLFRQNDTIKVENAKDALVASLNEKAALDLEYMSQIYEKSEDEIIEELGDLAYLDPDLQKWVTSDEYLSGDVKTKLVNAEKASIRDITLSRNVIALEKVIPKDKLPSEIHASMGANWIPEKYYDEFAKRISGANTVTIIYNKVNSKWYLNIIGYRDTNLMENEFGTPSVSSIHLMQLAMNMQSPEVLKTITENGKDKRVIDPDKTEAAIQKQNVLKDEWESWIWSDPDRSIDLATIYNDQFNRTVNRKYDGSHLKLPGLNPDIKLEPSQKNAIWQGIIERNVLLDNVVGAGKTFTKVAIFKELQRLGFTNKTMIGVPNHLTLQWRDEFNRLYPGSNVLAATPDDFEKVNRQNFYSKIALNRYDAVIVGHSSLKKIALNPEYEAKLYKDQIYDLAKAIEKMKEARGDRNVVRDMERIKKNLEAKHKRLLEKAGTKDNVLTFDQLGIDALGIDEWHEFKNLSFYTQMNKIAGMGNPAGSGRASDLFHKFQWMFDTYGDKPTILTATGTVISNSMVEMYTVLRYHKFKELKERNLHLFDAWAHMWGKIEHVYEISTSGIGFRRSERFTRFKNMGSLMALYHSFANVVTRDDLIRNAAAQGRKFPLPKIAGGKPQNIVANRSPQQAEYFGVPFVAKDDNGNFKFAHNYDKSIVWKDHDTDKWHIVAADNPDKVFKSFESEDACKTYYVENCLTPIIDIDKDTLLGKFSRLPELIKKTDGKINALSLTTLANKAGLDLRIINPYAEDYPGSKINLSLTNMMHLYQKWDHVRGTQLVFCDMSVPNSAQKGMSETSRRVYVREGDLIGHCHGTLHAIEDFEQYRVFVVSKPINGKKTFAIHEPSTGLAIKELFSSKKEALEWYTSYIALEDGRSSYETLILDNEIISEEEIDDYRAENNLEVAEDGSNEFHPSEILAVSTKVQFSVYEDIKQKLIAQGIPEHEIAFIHDYDTPTKKAVLYHNVNLGSVRFLLGSTAKMGAGTNVQKRLVGLHHIDCPWTPKDLEQREGRIIRQGNLLYEADPDNFEVFIGRYSTEQTYDARRWQLIEHKAAGIESYKRYSGENEIDGDVGEASNASEMKAVTSGNPLILQEVKLKEELKKLHGLFNAHKDSQMMIAREIKDIIYTNEEWIPDRLKRYENALKLLARHQDQTGKDTYRCITVPGQTIYSNEEFVKYCEKKLAFSKIINFTFRGLEVNIEDLKSGKVVYSLDNQDLAVVNRDDVSIPGLITRIRNYIQDIQADIDYQNNKLKRNSEELKKLMPLKGKPFELQQQYNDALSLHSLVKRVLMHQTQLEAIHPNERAKFQIVIEKRENHLIQAGFAKYVHNYRNEKKMNPAELQQKIEALAMPKAKRQSIEMGR